MDFFFDIGMTVLLRYLRNGSQLRQAESAFRKLFNTIGTTYGWTTCPAEKPQGTLPIGS